MFSFIVADKGLCDSAVTQTYMKVVYDSCIKTGADTEYVKKGDLPANKKSFIVTDTIQDALFYMKKGYRNHVVWMQGVVPEESYMRRHSKIRRFLIGVLEKKVLKKARFLFLVSEAMLVHYEKKYRLKLRDKSVIMPCFNETEVEKDAFKDEKYARNDFVYVGSLAAWQCFEQTVRAYSEIEKRSSVPTKLFVYTFSKDKAAEIIKAHGILNYEVDCVPKEELSEKIKSIKYGFVIREDCVVNNVATPTKFSNYLANGIIPIYSSALNDFAAFDEKNGLGIVYDLSDIEKGTKAILEHIEKNISAAEVKEKCEKAFATYYNAELYLKEVVEKLLQIEGR